MTFNNACKLLFGIAFGLSGVATAVADPIINVEYDPAINFSAADKATVQSAIDFYTSNITNNFTLTIAIGQQAGSGATTSSFSQTVDYNAYYNALVTESSPTDTTRQTAIASLGPGPHTNNPVTDTTNVKMRPVLAALLGIGSEVSDSFAECGGLTANACIQIGAEDLNATGTPGAALFGEVEHEVDEVLGTSSALSSNGGGTLPTDPSVADLYRYSDPSVRSFAFNTSMDMPCTGSPTAYLSINSGVTNLDQYNNCNNGGDYGDWIYTDGKQVQDAFGPPDQASSLSLSSPEVALLDAVGYNFISPSTAVPEPSSLGLVAIALVSAILVRRKRARRVV